MTTRILVVDDDPVVCESLAIMLGDCGYTVAKAQSGHDALNLIEETQFDLVLADYRMPEMNGEQLARQIKILLPEMPVILATGGNQVNAAPPVDLILQKPFSIQELRDAVSSVA